MAHGLCFNLSDPEELQETVAATVGMTRVRPAKGADFFARLNMRPKRKIGLFTIKADSIKVHIEAPMPYFGINIPLCRPFSISQSGSHHEYLGDINLTRPDTPIDIEAVEDCRVMAVFLYCEILQEHAAGLNRSATSLETRMPTKLNMATPAGHALIRSLAYLWSEPLPGNQIPGAQIKLAELEDEVITNFILSATQAGKDQEHSCPDTSPHCISLAEDFLCAHLDQPVSRANLAKASGASIRTLSRCFRRRHGMGPMQFLKARRLDATYRELLGAQHGDCHVTDVAMRYGFNHLGKFALDYKKAFHESPSETLRS